MKPGSVHRAASGNCFHAGPSQAKNPELHLAHSRDGVSRAAAETQSRAVMGMLIHAQGQWDCQVESSTRAPGSAWASGVTTRSAVADPHCKSFLGSATVASPAVLF